VGAFALLSGTGCRNAELPCATRAGDLNWTGRRGTPAGRRLRSGLGCRRTARTRQGFGGNLHLGFAMRALAFAPRRCVRRAHPLSTSRTMEFDGHERTPVSSMVPERHGMAYREMGRRDGVTERQRVGETEDLLHITFRTSLRPSVSPSLGPSVPRSLRLPLAASVKSCYGESRDADPT
jgi:hypothetical protein